MILRLLSSALIFFALSNVSYAFDDEEFDDNSDLYTIELIVFKFNQLEETDASLWKPAVPLTLQNALEINFPEKVEFINDELPPPARPIKPLSQADFVLKREESRIANNGQYTLLLHTGWKQKLTDPTSSPKVRIHGGGFYDREGSDIDEVDGTITISKGKFINIKSNLFLTEPAYEITELPNGLLSYPMQNLRRTKENELNYIDNPVFGLLIKVTPPKETA